MAQDTVHDWGSAPEFVGPRHEFRERLLLDGFLAANPGRHVLNAGAGQGSFTRLLEASDFDVVSTDVSPSVCRVLRTVVHGPVHQADLTELPFEDSEFEAVILGEVLEHIEDDVGALRQVRRVLRPDGVIAASVPAHPEWFGPSDVWAGHVRRYTREQLIAAFSEAGFAVDRCRGWGFPVSAAYHRFLYDRRAASLANQSTTGRTARLFKAVLRVALQLDRLFVGRERGCLGFIVVARPR